MVNSNKLVWAVGAAVVLAASPALAFTPAVDCDGWSATAPWGSPAYAVGTATLERLQADGRWAAVTSSRDTDYLADAGDFQLSGTWSVADGGTHRVRLLTTVYDQVLTEPQSEADLADHVAISAADLSGTFECTPPLPPPPPSTDPRTPGYWKNHPAAWPVAGLTLGNGRYTQACLLTQLSRSTRGDARVKLIHHLIAAKLNLLSGTDPRVITGAPEADSRVGDSIGAADADLVDSGTFIVCADGSLTGSAPRGADKQYTESLKTALDVYNNL